MTALRSIAVTVEETTPGAFEWVLLERGVEWAPLRRAKRPVATYAKAVAAGLLALQEMVDDLDAGPREAEAEAQSRPPQRATFGFGFGSLK
jgi:hypothetical protein